MRTLERVAVVALLSLLVSGGVVASTTSRGVNINPELIQKGDIEILANEWNVNLVRACLASSDCGLCMTADASTQCRQIDFAKLDLVIDWCEEFGIQIVIDLHHFAGYNPHAIPQDFRLWDDPTLQQALVGFWRSVAERYASRGDVIYGYDLLNEPHTQEKTVPAVWNDLIEQIAQAIREVDTRHSIVVECGYGLPANFLPLVPLDDPNVVYSFHFGEPYTFTHQGHLGKPVELPYPSADLDKDYLRSLIEPAYEFKKRYDVPIYVGELIVYCYVDDASRCAYIRDCLDLFEEYGFDYTFWAYRSWPQASLEHIGYETSTKWIEEFVGETEALTIFKQYLSRNAPNGTETYPLERPSCLFDTAHWIPDFDDNPRTLNFAWRLTGPCNVVYHSSGPLTKEVLDGVDLLVTGGAYGTPYSAAEAEAIAEFVREGGALFFYGTKDWGNNRFLSRFGIQIHTARILSPEPAPYDQDPRTFYVRTFTGPPEIAASLALFPINYGSSLLVSSPAEAVALTDHGTWRDVNRNLITESDEEEGPFTVIGVSRYGSGRVAVSADDEFRDLCTWPTYAAIVAWLLQNETPQ